VSARLATRLLLFAAGLAAAGFVVQPLFVRPRGGEESAAPAAPARVRLLEPIGDLPRSPRFFVWTSDPEASGYLVQLFGAKGVTLFQDVTADTMLRLPSGTVDWNIVATATWRVTPLYGERAGAPTDTARFVLDTP
jgi:hypothetical protein